MCNSYCNITRSWKAEIIPEINILPRPLPEEGHRSLPVAYHESAKGYPNRKHLVQSTIKTTASRKMLTVNTLQQATNSSRAHATQLPGHRLHCLCHPAAHRGSKDHLHLDPTWSWQSIRLGASRESTCQDCIALRKTKPTKVSATLQYITSHHGKTKQFPMFMDKIFHQGHEPVSHYSCSKIPISCQNHQIPQCSQPSL